eukprot:TRINITY_DN36790_c0_g1_i1.p2 TRINITY_DN36790_c0_g1~~TRINITY_DN36790_c0_g1_i1.p2  ORF type:complete len:100 (-),score=12.05 TRINITY_DN36790_c0_g1_i1:582-881(-)
MGNSLRYLSSGLDHVQLPFAGRRADEASRIVRARHRTTLLLPMKEIALAKAFPHVMRIAESFVFVGKQRLDAVFSLTQSFRLRSSYCLKEIIPRSCSST